ncbi:hypothetical protein [Wolbachia endosymbiont of Oedothorax gibbosus]|uniref:hypothetical protein n=1 Tax=Wolbachia endosymbiont of Oedothorax gibbosus TaxID=931100 RepID=UPI002024005A|nr:hypothetical protein [Wolbachia endosymbiont of Oedothorax gibbosus]
MHFKLGKKVNPVFNVAKVRANSETLLILLTMFYYYVNKSINQYFVVSDCICSTLYVGCISHKDSTCKNFCDLNHDFFGYEHNNSSSPYPYYHNLEKLVTFWRLMR